MDVVCFRQDGKWFGLPQVLVADLVPSAAIEPVHDGPDFVGGTASFRNRSIVTVRLSPLLWPGRSGDWMRTRRSSERQAESMLVVGRVARRIGLPTDCVSCILDVRAERLVEHQAKVIRGSVITALLYHLDREITVLEPMRLVRLVETALGETALRIFSGKAGSRMADRCG